MTNPCPKCATQLPEAALFCSNYSAQVKCKQCNEALPADASFCIMCGEEVLKNKVSQPMNRIKLNESRTSRSIEAIFTDFVGGSMAETLLYFAGNSNLGPRKPVTVRPINPGQKSLFNADVIEEVKPSVGEEKAGEAPFELLTSGSNDRPAMQSDDSFLNGLFDEEGEGWILADPELKAKNKIDFCKRLTCVFLAFRHSKGVKPVPRQEANELMKSIGAYDGNFKAWLKDEKTLLYATEKELKLITPGTQFVKTILQQIQDPEIPAGWRVGTKSKSRKKRTAKKAGEGDENSDDAETN